MVLQCFVLVLFCFDLMLCSVLQIFRKLDHDLQHWYHNFVKLISTRFPHFNLRNIHVLIGCMGDNIIIFAAYTITRFGRKLPGHLFTKKTPSYGYRNPHYKPKTVWRPSQVYNGNPYSNKTAFSEWIEALGCKDTHYIFCVIWYCQYCRCLLDLPYTILSVLQWPSHPLLVPNSQCNPLRPSLWQVFQEFVGEYKVILALYSRKFQKQHHMCSIDDLNHFFYLNTYWDKITSMEIYCLAIYIASKLRLIDWEQFTCIIASN